MIRDSVVNGRGFAEALTDNRPPNRTLDGERLGGKGAALARLIAGGYPVPRTGVITTEAYRSFAESSTFQDSLRLLTGRDGFTKDEIDGLHDGVPIDEDVASAVAQLAMTIGNGGPVALRSSATVEDLHGSSFAGQYQSFLDVDSSNVGEVLATVRRVWASLWHPAPAAYRRAFGTPEDDAAMAVVVMEMIPATTAGVVFTVDPGGNNEASRVEAVEGLGEALVSGARTPSAWVVDRTRVSESELPEAARRALELSLDVEARFDNVPQDVEWAAQGDEVYLVQARPITVLETHDGFDSPIDDHELTTAGIVEMVPGVLPPLRWELNHFILGEAFRSFLDSVGIIRGSVAEGHSFVRRIRGRVAIDFDQLREAAGGVRGAVEEMERQYFGESSEAGAQVDIDRRSLGDRWAHIQQDARALSARHRVVDEAEVVVGATAHLREHRSDLTEMSNVELVSYAQRLVDLASRGLAAELGVAATAAAGYQRVEQMLAKHLGSEEAAHETQLLTAGSLAGLSRSPRASAAIFGGPTWEELGTTPARADRLIDQRQAERTLAEKLRSLPGWTRTRVLTGQVVDVRLRLIRRASRDVIEQTRRRELAKAAVLFIGGETRRVHQELGRRFVAQDLLDAADDIELLTTAEIVAAAKGAPRHRDDQLRRRRNWLSRYEAEGPLPIRFSGTPDRAPAPMPEGDLLEGWASSPGRYRGRARVLTDPTESLEPGEILVATTTDASWSPVFVQAGAVIVEQGGPLSHAAILARELGVPAVLNIEGATLVLDGCMVTVDGDGGSVVIEQRAGV